MKITVYDAAILYGLNDLARIARFHRGNITALKDILFGYSNTKKLVIHIAERYPNLIPYVCDMLKDKGNNEDILKLLVLI